MKRSTLTKVPQVTFAFRIVKILSTTLGETAGDAVTMTMTLGLGLGYLGGAAVFGAALALLAMLYATTSTSRVALFWAAFV